jgi:hypothetical protein
MPNNYISYPIFPCNHLLLPFENQNRQPTTALEKENMREGIDLTLKFKQSGHRGSTIQGCRPQVIVFLSVPATYQYSSILLQARKNCGCTDSSKSG